MQFRFGKTAQLFGNRCSFWNCSKTAELGHMAGTHYWMAPLSLGFPSECAVGSSNIGPRSFLLALIIRACPFFVQLGPVAWAQGMLHWRQSLGHLQWLGAWSKRVLARVLASRSPKDKMRFYPLPVVRFESDSNRDYRIITKWARDSYLRNPKHHGWPFHTLRERNNSRHRERNLWPKF